MRQIWLGRATISRITPNLTMNKPSPALSGGSPDFHPDEAIQDRHREKATAITRTHQSP